MTDTDTRKIGLGLLVLAVSTALLYGPATTGLALPLTVLAVGTLGLAAGAFLVGTSGGGRPV